MRYYLKKLTPQELGYRKGILTTGQYFYISKAAADFFPPLGSAVNNDTAILEFEVDYRDIPVFANLVYHNDKYNREEGTRDEYRIYLNKDIAPDDFYFRPDDIVVMERTGDITYILKRYREGAPIYDRLNSIIDNGLMRGKHALTNSII